jgi:HEAT repeat protein/squalene-hopene cyclase-like protein
MRAALLLLPVLLCAEDKTIRLAELKADSGYRLLFSVESPSALGPSDRIHVKLVSGPNVLLEKTLHAGDPDLYVPFRLKRDGAPELHVSGSRVRTHYRIESWPISTSLQAGQNHRWENASPMALGETVYASEDEAEYIPVPGTPRKAVMEGESATDWYRFEFRSPSPKLVFFQVEMIEGDNLPMDVSVFRLANGKPEEFYEGEDPVSLPHEVQALPGNKFTPRVLTEPGVYYVRVRANHPAYKLRTRLYDPPPYRDPRVAVRTALDYILAAGDSWLGNTPRRGGVLDRVASAHQETSLCVGCHPTHFSQRAQLYAARNGYPVVQRQQLQFLSERFYNNPRPFYGFEQQGAVWARMISAPANVLSRMSHLMDVFESEISLERRDAFHSGIAEYLKLYYATRDKLPPDETNGNTPLVSAHEVAWYSWKATKDARLPEMIARGEVKNMIDLCYQTLALADMGAAKYADQIRRNIERILALQRPDGQWSMQFDSKQPEVEFQTGHSLWALAAAGVPRDHPQVAKAIEYLLGRQQLFGGWMDPLQSFENFRTPFRETQMAVLALSSYFPLQDRTKGWNSPQPAVLATDPVELLRRLDETWDRPSEKVLGQVLKAAESGDVLVRQAAAETLGRLALPQTSGTLIKLLGDPSKLAQRSAAWALRQIYSRHEDTPAAPLLEALASRDERTRWGATRVFSAHFSALARRPEFVRALEKLAGDTSPVIRMQAFKGLWQSWFWSADESAKSSIEDTFLAALQQAQHPWVDENLREGIYNLADENIRYLYNNWVPLLGRAEDRGRAIRGRLAVEDRLSTKFAAVLEHGSDLQKKRLLSALADFPLRRGDVYDLTADLSKPGALVYSRIGNDTEQIAFFGASADRLAQAIVPLLDSNDSEIRRLAARASLVVRDVKFPGVNEVAGAPGLNTKRLAEKIDQSPETVEVAKLLHPMASTRTASSAGAKRAPQVKLDENYFRGYIQPILEKRGKDGYACVHCHASHTIFNATWSTVMNVVDTSAPENSLMLRKPTSTSETEGIAGSKIQSHGGGVRWPKDSPEYLTILEWIKGAKE